MERRLSRGDDDYLDMERRITTLEVNQNTFATTLKDTVTELKSITLSLATRRGAERITMLFGGGCLTFIGWLVEHLTHLGPTITTVIK